MTNPMQEALEREKAERARELAHGTPGVLHSLAERIARPRSHRICLACRKLIYSNEKIPVPEFAAKVCVCENPCVVETVW